MNAHSSLKRFVRQTAFFLKFKTYKSSRSVNDFWAELHRINHALRIQVYENTTRVVIDLWGFRLRLLQKLSVYHYVYIHYRLRTQRIIIVRRLLPTVKEFRKVPVVFDIFGEQFSYSLSHLEFHQQCYET